MSEVASIEMPRYKCHKEVWALKIEGLSEAAQDGSVVMAVFDRGYMPIVLSGDFMAKHKPVVGGYYVVYPGDGYKSFSPAKAFEDGYTLIA